MDTRINRKTVAVSAAMVLGLLVGGAVSPEPTKAELAAAPPSSIGAAAIGDIKQSMLLEPQLQALPEGLGWVLADGRDVAGSRFATITGMSRVPDLRGVFLRGKNYARPKATGNADGDLSLGAFQGYQNAAHTHGYQWMKPDNSVDGVDSCCFPSGEHHNVASQTIASGGNETRPNAVTVNYYIKIN